MDLKTRNSSNDEFVPLEGCLELVVHYSTLRARRMDISTTCLNYGSKDEII